MTEIKLTDNLGTTATFRNDRMLELFDSLGRHIFKVP